MAFALFVHDVAPGRASFAAALLDPKASVGFVEEMRMAAMKLHTRDQSPREGQRPESENPVQQVRSAYYCRPLLPAHGRNRSRKDPSSCGRELLQACRAAMSCRKGLHPVSQPSELCRLAALLVLSWLPSCRAPGHALCACSGPRLVQGICAFWRSPRQCMTCWSRL